jgi:hypothetical protein
MKPLIRLLSVTALVLGTAVAAVAAPPGKRPYASTAMTAAQVEQLQLGEEVGMVCMQCHSLAVDRIADKQHALELCREGGAIVCPSCSLKLKVVRHGPRSKSGHRGEIVFVNEAGEPCVFLVKLPGGKESPS